MIEKWKRRKSREEWQESRKEKRERPSKEKEKKEERAAKARKKQSGKRRKRSPTPLSSDLENYDQPGTSRNSLLSSSSSESGDIPHTTTRDV